MGSSHHHLQHPCPGQKQWKACEQAFSPGDTSHSYTTPNLSIWGPSNLYFDYRHNFCLKPSWQPPKRESPHWDFCWSIGSFIWVMHSSHTSVEKRSTLHHNKKLLYLLPEMMLSLWYLKIFATMDKTVLESPFLKEFCSALGENQHLAAVFVLKQAVFIGLPPKHP